MAGLHPPRLAYQRRTEAPDRGRWAAGHDFQPDHLRKGDHRRQLYDDLLNSLRSRTDLDAKGRYEILAIRDIQDAADILRPVYESSKRRDGYVSLEVSPYLARDTKGTIEEARTLWKAVGRENVMIKIPGTSEGIPAFQQAISEGINVNVTLLFAQDVYVKVAEAYIAGLEQYAAGGGDVSRMASVASFFISRIDSAVDAIIDAKLKASKDSSEQEQLKSIQGKVAIANGKQTYEKYQAHLRDSPAGKPWPPRARRPSACCGPAPAPKIRPTAMCCMSKN